MPNYSFVLLLLLLTVVTIISSIVLYYKRERFQNSIYSFFFDQSDNAIEEIRKSIRKTKCDEIIAFQEDFCSKEEEFQFCTLYKEKYENCKTSQKSSIFENKNNVIE